MTLENKVVTNKCTKNDVSPGIIQQETNAEEKLLAEQTFPHILCFKLKYLPRYIPNSIDSVSPSILNVPACLAKFEFD